MHRWLTIALALISALSVSLFLHTKRLPPLASIEGGFVDHQFHFTLLILGILFIAAHLVLGLAIWLRRSDPKITHGSARSETLFTIAILAIFAVLGITGSRVLAATRTTPDRAPIRLEVTGMQFQWYFRYPGADGTFGSTKPELIDASIGNPLGLDPADHSGDDDVVSALATVPLGRTIELTLHAQDVIHSFYVPAMRFKQDAVPGMATHLRFTPDRLGTYEVVCAELCGLGHYRMNTQLRVVSESEYTRLLAAHTKATR